MIKYSIYPKRRVKHSDNDHVIDIVPAVPRLLGPTAPGYSGNRNYTGWVSPNRKVKTQEELNKYLEDNPFKPGSWIVSKYMVPANSINTLNYVVAIEHEIDNVRFSHHGSPKILAIINYTIFTGYTPWRRWDDIESFRLLTTQEFEQLIKPNHDKLQDHIREARAAFLKSPNLWLY